MMDSTLRPDYVDLAVRTEAPYDKLPEATINTKLCRLLHASVGLCTEIGELFEALDSPAFAEHAKEEIGDLWWYTAILYSALDRPLHHMIGNLRQYGPNRHLIDMACATGNIQDVVKRSLFYGKEIDYKRLDEQSVLLVGHLVLLGCAVYVRPCDAQDANIAKLRARYPAKFTEDAAVNRNIEKERQALTIETAEEAQARCNKEEQVFCENDNGVYPTKPE